MSARLMGHTEDEWLEHIGRLFDDANEVEDIPLSALLYAWPGKVTQADKDWADAQVAETKYGPTSADR